MSRRKRILMAALALSAATAHAQSRMTAVPLTEKDGMIYLRATINGTEVWALLDSGTNHVVVDESVVDSKGCKKVVLLAASGDTGACRKEADISVYGLKLPPQVFVYRLPSGIKALIPLSVLAPGGSVTFDYENKQILISRRD